MWANEHEGFRAVGRQRLHRRLRHCLVSGGVGCLIGLALAAPAATQTERTDKGLPRFEARFGGLIFSRDTDLIFSTDAGLGTRFDLEDDLGQDRSDAVVRFDGLYRFSKRHRVDFSYFRISRSSRVVIDRELTIGDQVFDINADVESRLSVGIWKLMYSYMVVARDRFDFGLSIGLYAQRNRVRFKEVTLGDFFADDLTVPLPVIGGRARYDITRRLHARASIESFFGIEVDKYDGTLIDAQGGLEYDITRNVGLGVGYNWIRTKINADNPIIDWNIDWRVSGVHAYAKVAF